MFLVNTNMCYTCRPHLCFSTIKLPLCVQAECVHIANVPMSFTNTLCLAHAAAGCSDPAVMLAGLTCIAFVRFCTLEHLVLV